MRFLFLFLLTLAPLGQAADIVVASKQFTEGYVLAEMTAGVLENSGYSVERKLGLGGSVVVFNALKAGEIDVYPDYTGTLGQILLQNTTASRAEIEIALLEYDLEIIAELGFNNTYALAMPEKQAAELGIANISDLRDHPDLRPALSLEFLNRHDGWAPLQTAYQLPHQARGLDHALSYIALSKGQADFIDAFSTDGELQRYNLTLLADDLQFFPRYDAVIVARIDRPVGIDAALGILSGSLDEAIIQKLNFDAAEQSPAAAAHAFLQQLGAADESTQMKETGIWHSILDNTLVHVQMTMIALLLACTVAIPLGLALSGKPTWSGPALYVAGLLQTIPSLALLALMIPLLGLGKVPAITALFLYSLLPILRNTLTGIAGVDPLLKQLADGMGLTPMQRLWKVEVPLALPTLLAGVKTAAIISIGTATLAAFVGAGGLGEPIITGLTLNNHSLILQGAIPAAALAIVTEFLFEGMERKITPRHLRQIST